MIPQLNEGEIYAGAIIAPDGMGHHFILLQERPKVGTWDAAMEWAKSIGGDLPDRIEQALLHKHLPDQFLKDWYWSSEQHAANSDGAWCQGFDYGNQYTNGKSAKLRARAVRRVAIKAGS